MAPDKLGGSIMSTRHCRIFFVIFFACTVQTAPAADVAFRKHVIDADAQFCAACVFDVNHDGKLDIVCGSYWYEAPTWKKHFVREVEALGNPPRFDGYAHLPMDVNGDGWTDVITVNYRSKSLKWLEHPGPGFGPWTAHTIDEPGPMETGRLVDINGDGQLDILPNGVQVAGWWELVREKNADGIVTPRFIRHDLPREVAGHGVGFGDIDGDGRGDIVGPRGWLQAPVDRREGRWLWHPEFDLDTASVPILVVDVNGDGHNDIVWGRAHNFGLYWLEQDASDPKQRRWIKHAIDTSWGGAHAPLWADLDGDGVPELIVGKRYLPHEGRDPGEYDPLVSYRYQFDRNTRTWHRWPISLEDGVGFGLDPKVVDLDGDGDLDLVCSDRCGLYWLENLRISSDPTPPPAVEPARPTYDDHTQLMVVKDRNGATRPVATPFDWGLRRAHILAGMEAFLGALPDSYQRVPLDVKTIEEKTLDGYTVRKLTFATAPGERISATLLFPAGLQAKAPAIVCLSGWCGAVREARLYLPRARVSSRCRRGDEICLEQHPSARSVGNASRSKHRCPRLHRRRRNQPIGVIHRGIRSTHRRHRVQRRPLDDRPTARQGACQFRPRRTIAPTTRTLRTPAGANSIRSPRSRRRHCPTRHLHHFLRSPITISPPTASSKRSPAPLPCSNSAASSKSCRRFILKNRRRRPIPIAPTPIGGWMKS